MNLKNAYQLPGGKNLKKNLDYHMLMAKSRHIFRVACHQKAGLIKTPHHVVCSGVLNLFSQVRSLPDRFALACAYRVTAWRLRPIELVLVQNRCCGITNTAGLPFLYHKTSIMCRVKLDSLDSCRYTEVQLLIIIHPELTYFSMPDIRVFIAIELPLPIQNSIDSIISQLKTQNLKAVRWVSAKNIHLTLKFIGEIPAQNINSINTVLSETATNFKPFDLDISGIGAFPNLHRPRVIWLGLNAPPALSEMQKAIEKGCRSINVLGDDKPFSPHLTIGRIVRDSNPQDLQPIESIISHQNISTVGTLLVKSICLFKSDLNPTGSVYTRLSTFPLSKEVKSEYN
jgi:RNA 2',3'-cyclic 3'-phosphodiesterase